MTNRMWGRRYLGRVTQSPVSSSGYRFATVRVLTACDATTRRWLPGGDDMSSDFPSKGCVHWHEAEYGGLATKGRVVSFEVDPDVDRPERAERYQLAHESEAWEVLDFGSSESDVAVQRAFTGSEGALVHPEPLSMRALVRLPSGVCAGPFRLKPASLAGYFVVEAPALGADLTRVQCWRPGPGDIDAVFVDGHRRHFIGPFSTATGNAHPQNWATDEQVARKVLDALRKMDKDAIDRVNRATKVEVTQKVFEAYLECVDKGRFGKQLPEVERARADRLRALQAVMAADEALLDDVLTTLHSVPSVQQQLADRADTTFRVLVETRRAELEPTLRETQQELERVREEIAERRRVAASLTADIVQKRSDLDAAVAGYERALEDRLAGLMARPESAFAELAVAHALAQVVGRGTRTTGRGMASPVLITARSASQAGQDQDVGTDAARRAEGSPADRHTVALGKIAVGLARAARKADVSRHAMLAVHGALAAGLVPVVEGSQAYALLRAYGRAVAGGRLHWVPVTPTTLEPADLLGRRDAPSGRFLPAPTGLLDVIATATDRDELHLVVLDGCNRAPAESYLLPILQAAEARRTGDETRTIPLASPASLADDDPYRRFTRLEWPPNVLVACIPVDGPATLPIPPSVWRHCAMVCAPPSGGIDELEGESRSLAGSLDPPDALAASEVSGPTWREHPLLAPDADCDALKVREALVTRAKEWRLTAQDLREAEAVWRALRASGDSSELPATIAAFNVLAVRAASTPPHAANALRNATGAAAELREIVDAVVRLCS